MTQRLVSPIFAQRVFDLLEYSWLPLFSVSEMDPAGFPVPAAMSGVPRWRETDRFIHDYYPTGEQVNPGSSQSASDESVGKVFLT
jgi:hypothetical protein